MIVDAITSEGSLNWLIVASPQWCPPCRALLPELRKASIQLAGQMKFGTIDCTVHHGLCSMVRSSSRTCNVTICSSSWNSTRQKCHFNQKRHFYVCDFPLFSTTSRPTRPRSSSTAPQCMNMKVITRLTASWSSFRCCWSNNNGCIFPLNCNRVETQSKTGCSSTFWVS